MQMQMVIIMELIAYERDEYDYQIKIGACFESAVHKLKEDAWYDFFNEKGILSFETLEEQM